MPNHITNELTASPEVIRFLASESSPVDFNTLIPIPEIMRGSVPIHIETWAEIAVNGIPFVKAPNTTNPAEAFESGDYESASDVLHQSTTIRQLVEGPFPKGFSDKDFERYIQCIRALRQYGHTSWYDWSVANWGTKWNAYEVESVSDRQVRFQTAWSMPKGIITALAERFPGETIRIRWADEDFGSNVGDLTFRGKKILTGGDFEDRSPEAIQLAFELIYKNELPEDAASFSVTEGIVWKDV